MSDEELKGWIVIAWAVITCVIICLKKNNI
jgi:hypothetical protein